MIILNHLFHLAYDADNNEAGINNNRKYLLTKRKIENYNIMIDGRNFCDQPINDLRKEYDEVRKKTAGQGDDYTTGYLLNYEYFK